MEDSEIDTSADYSLSRSILVAERFHAKSTDVQVTREPVRRVAHAMEAEATPAQMRRKHGPPRRLPDQRGDARHQGVRLVIVNGFGLRQPKREAGAERIEAKSPVRNPVA